MATATQRTDLDLDHFRELLSEERARLEDDLAKLNAMEESGGPRGETATELADYDQHMADQGTETFLREQDQAIHLGLRSSLDQVERACAKLDRGTYGVCDRCGANIAEERLEFVPHAIYCMNCASDIEARF